MTKSQPIYAVLLLIVIAIAAASAAQAPRTDRPVRAKAADPAAGTPVADPAAGQAADATMTVDERAHLIKLLQDSQKEYLSYLENVSEAQWNWKPAPDRWSVGQTAEHILLAESVLFGAAQRALASPANPNWEKATAGKTELLERVMPDRSHKAIAPESVQPQQGLSKSEVIRRFTEARTKTLQFVQETQAPLKEHTVEHPFPIFNTLNAYQWLLYIPLHNLRHDQQIAEVKATPGYPK